MGITLILSTLYMWWTSVPYFPLGHPAIRGWLVLRALFGFVGLFTLYYSVHYLPLAEATVFRFLSKHHSSPPAGPCLSCFGVFRNATL